jgi:hypothetical protein
MKSMTINEKADLGEESDAQIGESVKLGEEDAHQGARGNKEAVAGQYPASESLREHLEGDHQSNEEQDGTGRLDGQTTSVSKND